MSFFWAVFPISIDFANLQLAVQYFDMRGEVDEEDDIASTYGSDVTYNHMSNMHVGANTSSLSAFYSLLSSVLTIVFLSHC